MSPQLPYKVLCVCLGNICRSPTAEVVLRQYSQAKQLNVEVDSAGTSNYHPNHAPDLRSQQYALKRGFDLSSLRARQIQLDDFFLFDLILAMDHENLAAIRALCVKAERQAGDLKPIRAKIALMSEYDPIYPNQAIPDPYYGEAIDFERVLDQCESSSKAWVKQIESMTPTRVK